MNEETVPYTIMQRLRHLAAQAHEDVSPGPKLIFVLILLAESSGFPAVSVTYLARVAGVGQASVRAALARLAKHGMVEKAQWSSSNASYWRTVEVRDVLG